MVSVSDDDADTHDKHICVISIKHIKQKMNCKPFRLKIIIVIVPTQIDDQCTRTFTVRCPFLSRARGEGAGRLSVFFVRFERANVSALFSNDAFKTLNYTILFLSAPRSVLMLLRYLATSLFYIICWLVTMPQMIPPANCLAIAGCYFSWTALTQRSLRTFSTVLHWWCFTPNWLLSGIRSLCHSFRLMAGSMSELF